MARTRTEQVSTVLPDIAPSGTSVTLRMEESGWTAVVTIPLPNGGTLTQIVRLADLNATKSARAATTLDDLYDRAVTLAGFTQS